MAAAALEPRPGQIGAFGRYYGYCSNRSRGARRLAEQERDTSASIVIDEPTVDARRKASWACLVRKVYELDPIRCLNCGATIRIIALIDDTDVIEHILKHLNVWDPQPKTISAAGPDPPWPQGETIPLTYHPVPDIA